MDEEFINKFIKNLKDNKIDENYIQSIDELIKSNKLTDQEIINLIEGVIDG